MLSDLLSIIGRRPEEHCTILRLPREGGKMLTDWTTVGKAEAVAAGYAGEFNIFYGVQPLDPPAAGGRGRAGDVSGVSTLYADLDYKAMTPAQALEVVEILTHVLGAAPSAIVASGGGQHPYWPVERMEPLMAAGVMLWWREQVIAAAATVGVAVDTGVYDLSRILRIPGPPNLKICYGPQGTRTGLVVPGPRYELSQVEIISAMAEHPVDGRTRATFTRDGTTLIAARGASGDDRVFNTDQAIGYIHRPDGALALMGATELGAGFNDALNRACFEISAFCPEFLDEDMAVGVVLDYLMRVFPGGPDAQDWATIKSGFGQSVWTARRPTPEELANPFSPYCDTVALWKAQGSQGSGGEVERPVEIHYTEPAGRNSTETGTEYNGARRLVVTCASDIGVAATDWLWEHNGEFWVPLGALVLLGGREGVGKSTWTARLVAQVTTGKMEGKYLDQPKGVVICAAEDDWKTTINPRLKAAGADLDRVFRVDAQEGEHTAGLILPTDIDGLKKVVKAQDVALIVLDPLLGAIAGKLDTHKDSDVRQALAPLSALAHDSRATVLGLIHENKASSGDLITKLMGSRAFPAVARAVLVCAHEGERPPPPGPFNPYAKTEPSPESYLFGQLKNNLGPRVRTSVRYEIQSAQVAFDPEKMKHVVSSKIKIVDYSAETDIQEMVNEKARDVDGRRAVGGNQKDRCMAWLRDYLAAAPKLGSEVKAAAEDAGFSLSTLKKAASALILTHTGDASAPLWSLGTGQQTTLV